MPPDAVPIVRPDINHVPRLVFTGRLAVEVNGEVDQGVIRRFKSLGKEVIGIARVSNSLGVGIPRSLGLFDKSIVILNSSIGDAWVRYVMNLVNTVVGFTLDALMRLIRVRPHLLNLPSELFVDPVMDGGIEVVPRELPKPVVEWLLDYVDSGGDLYLLVRGDSLMDPELVSRSSLVFTYDAWLAETYNAVIRGGLGNGVTVGHDCPFCGPSFNPTCILLCPSINVVRELRVD